MNKTIETLRDWGCDVKGALSRVLNNESMYIMFLPMVIKEPAFGKLGTAISARDVKAVFEQSHLIKGVAANMGLTPLVDEVSKIVEPSRAGSLEGAQEAYASLMEKFEHFKKIVQG